jgi:MFS family permease
MTEPATAEPSGLAPLRRPVFAVLWTATVLGNIGVWMRDSTSAWLMTSLDPSPTMVALVQAASMLPVFLFSLPAGALADILDRRRMMIAVQLGLAILSVILAVAAAAGWMTPWLLLGLTLLAGAGAALGNPVWQAVVPELVPRAELRPAVALNSLGINIARAIGPALGGAIIAAAGVAAAYAIDVVSYAVVLAALFWWPRKAEPVLRPERLGGAMQAGLRFALRHPPLQRTILRAGIFFLFGAGYWALLPLVARQTLHVGAGGYGLMQGALGLGAIVGALAMPRIRRHVGPDAMLAGGAVLTACATAALALVAEFAAALGVLAVAGAAWIAVLTTLNATAQGVLPNWVRARGLAVYLTVYAGALTLGSTIWGQLAGAIGHGPALLVAGATGALAAALAWRLKLPAADDDLSPSHHWPEPLMTAEAGDGPAWITIRYRVPPADQPAFAAVLADLARVRRRDGAIQWGAYVDVTDLSLVVEWFVTPSWDEHMRQHERVSTADRALQARAVAFHVGDAPPDVAHHIALSARAAGR